MKTLTKIGVVALFAFFLTACDKLSDNIVGKTDSPKTDSPKAELTSTQQGMEDLQKISDWNAEQEKILTVAQEELQKTLEEDPAKAVEALTAFNVKIEETLNSLDKIEIKHSEVVAFRIKMKKTLELSMALIAESVKAIATPSAATELQQSIQDKVQELQQQSIELQQLEADLKQKFVK